MSTTPDIIAGPAIITFDSVTWHTEDDIVVNVAQETWSPNSSRFGQFGKRVKSLPVGVITFKPCGMITAALLAKSIIPYTYAQIGTSIFSAADKPVVIHSVDGHTYTFKRGGISGVAGGNFGAQATAYDGSISITVLHGKGTDPAVADNFLVIAAAAFTDVTFDETKVITPGYTLAYGTTPFAAIESLNGFKVSCPISVAPIACDRFGTVDMLLSSIGPAEVSVAPAGLTDANYLTLANCDGTAVRMPGTLVGSGTTDVVITGTGLVVTVPKCGVYASGVAFGTVKDRHGQVTFSNRAVFTAGVGAAPMSFTVS